MLPIAFMALIEDKNDQVLFNEFVDKYERLLMLKAYEILEDFGAAEDAVMETFLRTANCFQKIHYFGLAKIAAYSVIIIRNVCNDMLEAKQKKPLLFDDDALDEIPDDQYDVMPDNLIVASAVAGLPDMYKDVIILKYYYGFNIQEIADQLSLSYNGVRWRIDKALKMLRKEFADE